MQHTNIYGYKTWYQEYMVIFAREGYASRGLYASAGSRAKGVPTNNQGTRIRVSRHAIPAALLVRVQRSRKDL